MAEDRKAEIDELKKQLGLVNVNIKNAVNNLNSGKVVPPASIEDMYSQRKKLLAEIKKLEEAPAESPESPEEQPKQPEQEYGIPSHLRIPRRPYTMSAAAQKQREKAGNSPRKAESMKGNRNAWKTGEYAQGLVRQIFRPCKSTCPKYPCALVEENEVEPGEMCLDKVEFVKALQAVQKALSEGNLDEFKELAAVRIAGGMEVLGQLIEDILRDGTLMKSEKWDKFGQVIGYEIKNHPSLFPLAKLFESLRISPQEFMITPLVVKKTKTGSKVAKTLADIMSGLGVPAAPEEED